ncbi:MAG: cell division protein ZapA [Chromatiales bacterium]
MSDNLSPVTVQILDKEYRIGCEEGEEESLLFSARYLDGKMREIRRAGRVIGAERIAVMAALNIAHELLQHHRAGKSQTESVQRRLNELQERIELALSATNQLEL